GLAVARSGVESNHWPGSSQTTTSLPKRPLHPLAGFRQHVKLDPLVSRLHLCTRRSRQSQHVTYLMLVCLVATAGQRIGQHERGGLTRIADSAGSTTEACENASDTTRAAYR